MLEKALLGVCAVALALTAGTSAAETRKVRFVTEDFAPFSTLDNDAVVGPGREVADFLCRRIGWDCAFTLYPFRRCIQMMQDGEADGIFSLLRTPERDLFLFFSRPYVASAYGVFLPAGAAAPRNVTDLDGYTLAAYGPSGTFTSLERLAGRLPSLRLEQEVNFETPFRKLGAGRYPAPAGVFANLDVGRHFLASRNISGIVAALPVETINYHFAFSRKVMAASDAALFDRALADAFADGALKTLLAGHKLNPPSAEDFAAQKP